MGRGGTENHHKTKVNHLLKYSFLLSSAICDCPSCCCQNGGTPQQESNGYSCTCVDGYSGCHCETGKESITSLFGAYLWQT